jgi:uncharacterized SAM-binding protein YcdF (DUF218 family)
MVPGRAEAIVVLGHTVRRDGTPGALLRRRTERGIRLMQQGCADALVLTGGSKTGGPAEAEVMRELALAAGISAARILTEPLARNTFENAHRTAALMHAKGWSRALVVTDWAHLPRALLAFRSAGIRARGVVVGIPFERRRAWALPAHLLYESAGLAWYATVLAMGLRRGRRAGPP